MERIGWIGIATAWLALGCAGDVMHEREAVPDGRPLSGPCDAVSEFGYDCTAGACGDTPYEPADADMCRQVTPAAHESVGALLPGSEHTGRAFNVWLIAGTCVRVRVSPGSEVQLPTGETGTCGVFYSAEKSELPIRAWSWKGVPTAVAVDAWPADSLELCPLVCE